MWVDETGSNSRDNGPPSYGYALRGVTHTTHRKNIEQMLIAELHLQGMNIEIMQKQHKIAVL